MKSTLNRTFLLLAMMATTDGGGLRASDWPQYRGPGHDGISTELIRTNWAQETPLRVWRVNIGPGLGSLSIAGGRVFTQVRRYVGNQDSEVCVALNATTGAELWATPMGIADYPDGGVGGDDGPRTTPSVDGGLVYVFSSYLRLFCLNATNGTVVWSRNFMTELGATLIQWQNAASPLVIGELVIVNCNAPTGSLMALNKLTGAVVWRGENDAMTHATPVYTTAAGVPQVVFFTQTGLASLAPASGSVLWRYTFPYNNISFGASPVVGSNFVYCSGAYGSGAAGVQLTGNGAAVSAAQAWRTPGANMNHWATPVFHEGHIYGIYGQSLISLRCIVMATGVERWRQSLSGQGAGVLLVSGYLLVTAENGDVILVRPQPTAYSEVARFNSVNGSVSGVPPKCWNVPAVSNGRIYHRSTTEAACYDVAPHLLRLQPLASGNPAAFRLLVSYQDGSPIPANRVTNIDVVTATNVSLNVTGWIRLTATPVLTNGQLRVDDTQTLAHPRRYYRAAERP